MKKTCAVITVGSEILRGQIVDTNSSFLSRKLMELGVDVASHITVKDEKKDIVDAIKFSEKNNIIILTGGLGPTEDDITLEILAEYLNVQLDYDEKLWEHIEKLFSNSTYTAPLSNKKQAYKMSKGSILHNEIGTACGHYINYNNKTYVILPGPPVENTLMTDNYLIPKLLTDLGTTKLPDKYVIRVYDTGESSLVEIFKAINKEKIELGYYVNLKGYIELYFINKLFLPANDFNNIINDFKYALELNNVFFTEDTDLSLFVLEKLKEQNKKIMFAESMTGGAVSAELVTNPGASEVFNGGIVSYSNYLKNRLLDVNKDTIKNFDAVSEETIKEMITGLVNNYNCDVAAAISGYATGHNNEVWFAFFHDENIFVKQKYFRGDRSKVIRKAVNYIYMELYKLLT